MQRRHAHRAKRATFRRLAEASVALVLLAQAILVAGPQGASADILTAGKNTRVSVDSNGNQGALFEGVNGATAMTPDGRFVAFATNAPLDAPAEAGQKPSSSDIYVRDQVLGTTTLITQGPPPPVINAAGGPTPAAVGTNIALGGSFHPSISADGRFVAFDYQPPFVAGAGEMVSTPQDQCLGGSECTDYRDVFVADRGQPAGDGSFNPAVAPTYNLVSVFSESDPKKPGSFLEVQHEVDSTFPSLSADGQQVALYTVVPVDHNGDGGFVPRPAVMVHNRALTAPGDNPGEGEAQRSFVFAQGLHVQVAGPDDGPAVNINLNVITDETTTSQEVLQFPPDISADGKHVAYALNLTICTGGFDECEGRENPGDTFNLTAIFSYDRDVDGNGVLDEPNPEGGPITTRNTLVTQDPQPDDDPPNNCDDVFPSGLIDEAECTLNFTASYAPSLNLDGSIVAYEFNSSRRHQIATDSGTELPNQIDVTKRLPEDGTADGAGPDTSTFASTACFPGETAFDTPGTNCGDHSDDTVQKATPSCSECTAVEVYSPSLSADGNYVAFVTNDEFLIDGISSERGEDVVPNDSAVSFDQILMVDLRPTTPIPEFGPRGQIVSVGEFDSSSDGRFCGQTPDGPLTGDISPSEGNDESSAPKVSADGRFVSFTSDADNLIGFAGSLSGYGDLPNDTNCAADAFVRELTPALQGAPNPTDFGTVTTGTVSGLTTVQFTNVGFGPTTAGKAVVSGTNVSDFTIVADTCNGKLLNGGDFCDVGVQFKPGADGTRTAQVVLPFQGPSFPQATSLSAPVRLIGTGGKGVPPIALLAGAPNPLVFTGVNVGEQSGTQNVVLRNAGNTPITINSITLAGANPGDFNFPTNGDACTGKTLAVGATCTVGVRSRPTAPGSRTATLSILDTAGQIINGNRVPHLIGLTVNAPQPTLLFNPGVVRPGTTTHLQGTNWAPGNTLAVTVGPGDQTPAFGPVTVDTNGNFDVTVLVLPKQEAVPIQVFVTDPGGFQVDTNVLVQLGSNQGNEALIIRH